MTDPAQPRTVDLVVRHGVVLTVDPSDTVHRDGAVAIDRGLIVGVGPTAEIDLAFKGRSEIDAQGGVVRPGYIDAHVHVSQYTARSVLPRMGAGPVTMGHWKAELRPEDEHASAALAAIDYLSCGYTGFVDPGTIFEPDAVARVADEIGIRIWLTDPYVADLGHKLAEKCPELVSPSFLARWPKSTDEAAQRVGAQLWRNKKADLVRAFVGIYGELTETDELRAHALDVARAHGVQFQTHLGYSPSAYHDQTAQLRRTPLAHIEALHGLDSGMTLTHMNLTEPEDEARILRCNPRLGWCPYGTLQMMGAGQSRNRMASLSRRGATVALATDIPRAINFDGIAGLAIGCAAALGAPVDARTILRMGTINAAASVGAAAETGSIEIGKSAEIVVHQPSELGVDDIWESVVLGGRHAVDRVLVRGRIQVESGRIQRVDPAVIAAGARNSTRGIIRRMGLP
jgi:cytosine/adenosine deaminase-related metal-dependent hydrolase